MSASNKIQIKRTSTSDRTPNTTNSANSQFLDTGELALNLTDGKLFSSNGTTYFEIGANVNSLRVVSINANGSAGSNNNVLKSNGTNVYWGTSTSAAAGSNTYIQFNDSDALGTDADFSYDKSTKTLNLGNNISNFSVGNSTVNTYITPGKLYLRGSEIIIGNATAGFANISPTSFNIGNVAVSNAGITIDGQAVVYSNNAGVANDAFHLGGVGPEGYVNTSGNYTITGVHSHTANLIINTTAGVIANGSIGSVGQILTSNGSTVYWSTAANGSAVPGSNTELIFNNSGDFATSSDLRFNGTTFTVGNSTVNTTANSTALKVNSIVANGSTGSNGHKFLSNGSATYWAATYTVGDSPPSNPNFGDIWWYTTDSKPYMRIYDGVNTYWFDFLPPA